jgi:molybdopterin molybdotransferase
MKIRLCGGIPVPVSFEEARFTILDAVTRLHSCLVPILEGLGRILAADMVCDRDHPPVPVAAADGYALRAGEGPGVYPVVGRVLPGAPTPSDPALRSCLAVSSGSVLPPACDAVAVLEDVTRQGDSIVLDQDIRPGQKVLEKGAYFCMGETIVKAGVLIHPEEINIAAALGQGAISVVRRPRVAVLVTGSELVEIGEDEGPGKIWGSNLYHIMARVAQVGGDPVKVGVIRDDPDALHRALEEALSCDAVVMTGGTSGGPGDLLKKALAKVGASLVFDETTFRPGRTFVFARSGDVPVFCLPGSPRSIVALFHLFVRPTLLKMMGQNLPDDEEIAAVLEQDLLTKPGTMKFLFSHLTKTVTGYSVRPLREIARGGFVTSDYVNALTVVPDDVAYLKSPFEVSVIPLHEM